MPSDHEWPSEWFSGIWFAVGANKHEISLKVYLNIKLDDSFKRWKKIGWVLKALGREASLERFCDLSTKVSRNSWPSGLAIDILPNGKAGRIKVYFESAEVYPDCLEKWYYATGGEWVLPHILKMIELFPWKKGLPYPEKAFFISLEFSADESISLKTDFSVSRWMENDICIVEGIKELLNNAGLKSTAYIKWLEAMGAWPPEKSVCQTHQLVGFGFEPDRTYHVNVYCRPPLVLLRKPKFY
jgi:hypothetical protein